VAGVLERVAGNSPRSIVIVTRRLERPSRALTRIETIAQSSWDANPSLTERVGQLFVAYREEIYRFLTGQGLPTSVAQDVTRVGGLTFKKGSMVIGVERTSTSFRCRLNFSPSSVSVVVFTPTIGRSGRFVDNSAHSER
jgi:hypothetical protein